jgi:MrfA Zn-binding domain
MARKTGPAPVFGELRPSQIITTFGPGSVVDLRNVSVLIAGTDFWVTQRDQEIDEPRLRSMLRVQRFYRPAVRSDGGVRGVPSFVFPQYLFCPRCRRLGRYDRADLFYLDRRRFRCKAKHDAKVARGGPVAFPARFVVACTEGHLDDFPWFDYAHRGKGGSGCRPERLQFRESARSAAISDLQVSCDICGARRSMEDAFGARALNALGPCRGARPWLGGGNVETCTGGVLKTTLRGASNLYFSQVQSALSIPEWDDPIHTAIAYHEEQLAKVDTVDKLRFGIGGGFLPRLEPYDPDRVFDALQRRRAQAETRPTPLDIRREEFVALGNSHAPGMTARREFQTEHVDVPAGFRDLIARVVIVRRLREVRALSGFTRIDSPFDVVADDDDQQDRYKIQALSATELNWRPAVELRGEGIFLELSEKAVRVWEDREAVRSRSAAMERIHSAWRRERELPEADYPGARFVLLHSLAHMLIQGLALDCGYSSTSIRERVYSASESANPMAGILLYTATPDSDGSLGGLADNGRPKRLEPLLRDALERAGFCSSDPLCGHGAPGEMGHLNGAACHACLLVSETSCERGNRYLDRAHVVETLAQLGTGYFEL